MRYSEFADFYITDKAKLDDYVDSAVAKAIDDDEFQAKKININQQNTLDVSNKPQTIGKQQMSPKPSKTKVPTNAHKQNPVAIKVSGNGADGEANKQVKIPIPIPYKQQKPHAHYKASVFKRKLQALDKFLPPLYPPTNILDI